jgi:hypothetical protein
VGAHQGGICRQFSAGVLARNSLTGFRINSKKNVTIFSLIGVPPALHVVFPLDGSRYYLLFIVHPSSQVIGPGCSRLF